MDKQLYNRWIYGSIIMLVILTIIYFSVGELHSKNDLIKKQAQKIRTLQQNCDFGDWR